MPSPIGWREVPCVECGTSVPGIDFGERCRECLQRRKRRAARIARRVALLSTAVAGAWVLWRLPESSLGRFYSGMSIPIVYLLVRMTVHRFAMEVLP
jgi:predicted nucleic acid-binding Zn ribbon protein